jgi:hypothetical protein
MEVSKNGEADCFPKRLKTPSRFTPKTEDYFRSVEQDLYSINDNLLTTPQHPRIEWDMFWDFERVQKKGFGRNKGRWGRYHSRERQNEG